METQLLECEAGICPDNLQLTLEVRLRDGAVALTCLPAARWHKQSSSASIAPATVV